MNTKSVVLSNTLLLFILSPPLSSLTANSYVQQKKPPQKTSVYGQVFQQLIPRTQNAASRSKGPLPVRSICKTSQ